MPNYSKKTIAAVVCVAVSLAVIVGVAVWAVFYTKEEAVDAVGSSSSGKITWRLPAFLNRIIIIENMRYFFAVKKTLCPNFHHFSVSMKNI